RPGTARQPALLPPPGSLRDLPGSDRPRRHRRLPRPRYPAPRIRACLRLVRGCGTGSAAPRRSARNRRMAARGIPRAGGGDVTKIVLIESRWGPAILILLGVCAIYFALEVEFTSYRTHGREPLVFLCG